MADEGAVQSGNPLVSAIIPVFNGEATVGDAIQSAQRQTYLHLEIIVVDDGSTDGTAAVVERYAAGDGRIRLVRQENGGVARARNRGLVEAQGELIATLDADDLWDPAKIERQVRRIQEAGERTGLVYCWFVRIDENGSVVDRSPGWKVEGETLGLLVQVNYTGNASTPLYRRHCMEEAGGYDESLAKCGAGGCEDWDLALKIAARYEVAVVPELLVGYRRSAGAMSLNVDAMARSHRMVMEGVRRREAGLPEVLVRRSEEQFALYAAGMLFWSGDYWRACRWWLRCGPLLMWQVLPYILRAMRRRKPGKAQRMIPGVPLDSAGIAEALIPYDRIYAGESGMDLPAAWRNDR